VGGNVSLIALKKLEQTVKIEARQFAAAITAGILIATSFAIPANAALVPGTSQSELSSAEVIDAVEIATPETVETASASDPLVTQDGGLSYSSDEVTVEVPANPADGLEVNVDGIAISIELPESTLDSELDTENSGFGSYDHGDGTYTVPVVLPDGGLQINTVISNADSPTSFTYGIDLREGGQMVDAGSGAVAVLDEMGEAVALILPPWALDAEGRVLETSYMIDGNELTQVVKHDQSDVVYPVVADPQFVWHWGPSVRLNRSETKSATTATGLAQVCGGVTRVAGYPAGILCGLNSASIIVNSQRIYYREKRCAQLLIGPGVVGTIGYSGGFCK
jgi:hypothetical protein